jgi:hypothetical protein
VNDDFHYLDFHFPGYYAIYEGRKFPPNGPHDSADNAWRNTDPWPPDYLGYWDGVQFSIFDTDKYEKPDAFAGCFPGR